MAYKCLNCGHIFDEGEERRWIEPHGEEMTGCPLCSEGYERTRQCKMCGGEFLEDELFGGICQDCIDGYSYDIDMCYKIGECDKESIEINSFLANSFRQLEIETILYSVLKEREKIRKIDCKNYIYEDLEYFAEKLAEEVNK